MNNQLSVKEKIAKNRLCLSLDVPKKEVKEVVHTLKEYIGLYRIDCGLYAEGGNEIIKNVHRWSQTGFDRLTPSFLIAPNIFLDLMFLGIPDRIYDAVRNSITKDTKYALKMLSVHVDGGEEMCKAALRAAEERAKIFCYEPPAEIIGVTALSSLDNKGMHQRGDNRRYSERVGNDILCAYKWGLNGAECPAGDGTMFNRTLRPEDKRFIFLCPGISFEGIHGANQKHILTPQQALCGDYPDKDGKNITPHPEKFELTKHHHLVVGSAILKAPHPRQAAKGILEAMASYV